MSQPQPLGDQLGGVPAGRTGGDLPGRKLQGDSAPLGRVTGARLAGGNYSTGVRRR